jgi:hypothetical protein
MGLSVDLFLHQTLADAANVLRFGFVDETVTPNGNAPQVSG